MSFSFIAQGWLIVFCKANKNNIQKYVIISWPNKNDIT